MSERDDVATFHEDRAGWVRCATCGREHGPMSEDGCRVVVAATVATLRDVATAPGVSEDVARVLAGCVADLLHVFDSLPGEGGRVWPQPGRQWLPCDVARALAVEGDGPDTVGVAGCAVEVDERAGVVRVTGAMPGEVGAMLEAYGTVGAVVDVHEVAGADAVRVTL